MTRLVAIDPGLARLGYAVFDVTGLTKHPKPEALAGRCLAFGSVSTSAEDELAVRLCQLTVATLTRVHDAGAGVGALVVIEKPSRPGGYMRREIGNFAAMAGGMMGLHLATGALAGGCSVAGYEVVFRAPNTLSKAERWERAKALLGKLPKTKGRTNKESRDALWLGCQVMLDGRRVW